MSSSPKPRRRATIALASAATLALLVTTAGSANAATAVGLGTADSFVVLAGAGVTNTNTTTLDGDLGAANGSVVGDTDLVFTSGANHYGDGVTTGAMLDLETAFGAASQPADVTVSADLGGQSLTPGVYSQAGTMNLSGSALTLDAGGDPDAVWIFRAGSDLIVGPGASVDLTNGAQACNVFWQVASSASLNDGADFIGTIIARTSITLNSGAVVEGRVLALDGSVTLIGNTITRPVCATAPTPDDSDDGTDDGTDDQITSVPTGSVATGDGSTSPRSFDLFLLSAGIVAVGAAAAVVASRLRRGRIA